MSDFEPCRVLIVDDEVLIRQGIKYYIDWEKEGFQIVGEASNGQEALNMIEEFNPHILITDMVMPLMDGEQLTKIVKKNYPEMEVIILSSFGDFDYVRSSFQNGAADYILKPKMDCQELLNVLRKAAHKIPNFRSVKPNSNKHLSIEQIIEKLLSGYDGGDYHENLITDVLPKEQYCFLSLLLPEKFKMKPSVLKEEICAMLPKYFQDVCCLPIKAEEASITFLLNVDVAHLPVVKKQLNELSRSTAALFPNIKWFLSKPFTAIKEIKKFYEENLWNMKQYLFYLPEMEVVICDALPPLPKEKKVFDLNHFLKMFQHKQFEEAFQYLLEYVDYLSRQYTKDVFEFKSFLGNIVFNITVLLENMKYNNQDLEKEKYRYFSEINEAKEVKEAIGFVNDFLDKVKKAVFSSGHPKSQSNIQLLLDYIEEHYADPLTLTEMAKHFHFNPTYLSAYFKTHHKEGFSEYLNRVRIKKSMELLTLSKISISDISAMVGYSDHSYFCKVFKKITGMSPSIYRRKYSSGE